ncbi:MAG: hypothetical protein H6828_00595 [Planctomycetes bacterium]|nr:hypothetical protein [Planctomycetota bacterium]
MNEPRERWARPERLPRWSGLLLLGAALGGAGCAADADTYEPLAPDLAARLAGEYAAGRDTLILRPDGSYRVEFAPCLAQLPALEGTWEAYAQEVRPPSDAELDDAALVAARAGHVTRGLCLTSTSGAGIFGAREPWAGVVETDAGGWVLYVPHYGTFVREPGAGAG